MTIFDRLFKKEKRPTRETASIAAVDEPTGRPDLAELISTLKHADPDHRSKAAEKLCEVGDAQAVKPLAEALLADESWLVRRYAAEALGYIGVSEAVAPLTAARDGDPYICNITGRRVVRIVAGEALKKIKASQSATTPLERILACRWTVTNISEEVAAQIEMLRRRCKSVTEAAVSDCLDAMNQLSNLDDSVIAEVMCYVTLDANHYKVRQFAATVLKAKSNPEINQILCHALQYERESSRPVTQALDALRVIGDPTTRDAIANFLNGFLSKWRMKGDTAISGMADAMAIGAHLDKEKSVCLGACRALAAFGNAEDISVLGSVLSDSYWGKYEEIRVELPKLIRQLEH